MTRRLQEWLLHLIHALCWCVLVCFVAVICGIFWLAYGIPGEWLQRYIDDAVPADVARVSVGRVAYRPGQGIILNDVVVASPEDGHAYVRFSRAKIHFSLLNFKPLSERLKRVEVDDLYVAQLVYDNDHSDPRQRFKPRPPRMDFSAFDLDLAPFEIVANRPDVLDIKGERVTARCFARDKHIYVTDIVGNVAHDSKVTGAVTINFPGRYVDILLLGTAYHSTIHGIYRALDFPLIEDYSSNFTLSAPAYGDAKIRVGLDKYDNLFTLDLGLVVSHPGDYCGVTFDEASGHIAINGVWDTITTINDIIARREGEIVAQGSLRFDCPANRFSFTASSTGLQPRECLDLVDMPFTDVLPPIECDLLPALELSGELPLLTPQRPKDVILRDGYFKSNGPCTLYDDYRIAHAELSFSMLSGTFLISEMYVDIGAEREDHVEATVEVIIPNEGEYVDIYADLSTTGVTLKNVRPKIAELLGDDAACIGVAELYCRTDETFLPTLWANFDMKVEGEKLARFNFFSIVTDFLANNIPGITALTDADEFYAKGSIRNGKIDIERARLEGSLFSIEGPVHYNLLTKAINASLVVGIFNEDSYLGMATRTLFLPLARAMWQVHIGGTSDNPTWRLQTIVGTMKNLVIGGANKLDTLTREALKEQDDRSKNEGENNDGAFTDIFLGE